jgi:hypothetical protein
MDTNNENNGQQTYFQRYTKKIFNVLLIVTLLWSILFAVWMIYNFNELDNVVMSGYFRCFVHTTMRKANFMKIAIDDCQYVNNLSLFSIIKKNLNF